MVTRFSAAAPKPAIAVKPTRKPTRKPTTQPRPDAKRLTLLKIANAMLDAPPQTPCTTSMQA